MSEFIQFDLPTFEDIRGSLTTIDRLMPFEIKRAFWIYGCNDRLRGGHRHKKTRQALFALSGTVKVYINDGVKAENIILNSPKKCLLVEPEDWHQMLLCRNAVLLVLASDEYDPSDYIYECYQDRV